MDRYSKEGDLSSSVFAVSRRWDFVENKSWNCVSGGNTFSGNRNTEIPFVPFLLVGYLGGILT